MTSTAIVGSTGLVGSFILSTLRNASPEQVASINVLARRPLPAPTGPNTSIAESAFINADLTTWARHLEARSPPPTVLFSALAATLAAAGGFDQVYQIDHDQNLALAKAAHKAGTKTYVLISSGGANPKSWMPYLRMKGEIDQHVQDIGFDHTVILRPGLLFGQRENLRLSETALRLVANGLGKVNARWLKDTWAVEAEVVARAAVAAGLKAANGDITDKVWIVDHPEIIKLGKTEWKGS